jgi:CheY-like chemotaxis protein
MRWGILIVDDDALLRFFLRKFLGKKDWEVFEAENGEEALSILEKTTIHLIITDLQMPVMGGLELLQRVRKDPRTGSIPIIMVTAEGDTIREKAIQLGASDFINKPVDEVDLLHRIRKTLGFVEDKAPSTEAEGEDKEKK